MKGIEKYTKGIIASESVKDRMIQLQKDTYNQAIDDVIKNIRLTEFAYEFLQEGSDDAIDYDSILKLKINN